MTRQEMILEAIKNLGYKPYIDDNGNLCVRYQMKLIVFMTDPDDEQYVVSIFPKFAEIHEGEETLTLAICNKMTRDAKLAKIYIDDSLKSVSACCEFFYTDTESLKNNVERSMNILGMIRSSYYKERASIVEQL